jgi:hypothetical protein
MCTCCVSLFTTNVTICGVVDKGVGSVAGIPVYNLSGGMELGVTCRKEDTTQIPIHQQEQNVSARSHQETGRCCPETAQKGDQP